MLTKLFNSFYVCYRKLKILDLFFVYNTLIIGLSKLCASNSNDHAMEVIKAMEHHTICMAQVECGGASAYKHTHRVRYSQESQLPIEDGISQQQKQIP